MTIKTKAALKTFSIALLISGFIIFTIGCYYWLIKAGLPYQDPPVELQIQYAINYGIGVTLLKKGFVCIICGAIFRLLLRKIS